MPINKDNAMPTAVPGIKRVSATRFLVRVGWRDKKTGKRKKREGVATSFAQAVALQEELRGTTAPVAPERTRFVDYAERWMKDFAHRLAPSTRDRYLYSLANVAEVLGDVYLDVLESSDVRRWRDRATRSLAPSTVNGYLRVLRQVLDAAVEDGIITGNVARRVRAVPEGRTKGPRGRALSVEEFRRFLSVTRLLGSNGTISPDVARMVQALAWTGMRMGEVSALRWSDQVDGELHVERAVWRRQEKSTKTDDPRRVVVVPPLAEVLGDQRRWLAEVRHPGVASGLVFPASPPAARASATRRGSDVLVWFRSPKVLAKPLRVIADVAGVPTISPHALRRTWENNLRRAGVDNLVRRSLAGWRTEAAQEIYATVDKGEREAAGAAIVQLVGEVATPSATPGPYNEKRPVEGDLRPGVIVEVF